MMCPKCEMENAMSTDTQCWNCGQNLVPEPAQPSGGVRCAAHGSAHSCEWENATKVQCGSRAEFLDAHGKKLCVFHASHLARRFHASMRPIENALNEKLCDRD